MSDLIIEGAKGLPDGLYMKKDGLLFKYKPNGGTVYTARAYHVTDRPKGEWNEGIFDVGYFCSNCGETSARTSNFCPNCGSDMRGNND